MRTELRIEVLEPHEAPAAAAVMEKEAMEAAVVGSVRQPEMVADMAEAVDSGEPTGTFGG